MKLYHALLIFFFFSCSTKKEMYQVECNSLNNEGYVELKISNLLNPNEYQIEQASIDAIKAVLYTGYSSVKCQSQKPMLNSIDEKENFKKIESSFFSKKGVWKNFIRNTNNSKSEIGFFVMVNKEELRKYLENKGVIKKLTKGF